MECEICLCQKTSSPSPPLQLPGTIENSRSKVAGAAKSVTNEEIGRYWRLKKMEEEEHLVAALKAAARIKARALSEKDYKRFEESLIRDVIKGANGGIDGDGSKLPRVGIKDWWTKSKYAYLNQPPAIKSLGDDAAS